MLLWARMMLEAIVRKLIAHSASLYSSVTCMRYSSLNCGCQTVDASWLRGCVDNMGLPHPRDRGGGKGRQGPGKDMGPAKGKRGWMAVGSPGQTKTARGEHGDRSEHHGSRQLASQSLHVAARCERAPSRDGCQLPRGCCLLRSRFYYIYSQGARFGADMA